ncbi:DNA-binding response regulator [Oceanidesulfovibrio indonesiensis]|uniref:DNA-binding response regulator n=1 Tax=Oceanidesulfovibrio indonesiensis TaxID=54767 RepID=A0A7M3MCX0_9BACT|nr:response regulator transcription factor [Oceanidesulfovibrio indonesiensis]TVM15943.1 DNA-binding response regulator [Oceanidesulfovibrio indonesiensis]
MHRIVLIDDDAELCFMLEEYFRGEGFLVHSYYDGASGLEAVLSEEWDLLILDVCLPDRNGFELLGQLRMESNLPVLMLTGRSDVVDKVVGLEIGADDYLAKPFEPRELLARVRALTRRSRRRSASSAEIKTVMAGDIVLNTGTRRVYVNGTEVRLTNAEFIILQMLLSAQGNLVSREDISRIALNRELAPFDRSIDVHISNLRRKLGSPPWGGARIATIRGAGYLYTAFEPSDDEFAKDERCAHGSGGKE